MPVTQTALTALSASVVLPSGSTIKSNDVQVTEKITTDDSQGLADGGYSMPVQTAQELTISMKGFATDQSLGFATNPGPLAFTITLANGNTLAGNLVFTKRDIKLQTKKLIAADLEADSFGPYTETSTAS